MRMKKNLTTPTALVLASAVLSNSCNSGYFSEQVSNDQFAIYDVSKEFIPVETLLDDTSMDYLNNLSTMFNDVYANKKSQELLRKSPELYFAQYNIPSEVDIENSEFKLLFALTDEEILNALKNNDIQTFIRICNQKNYFTNVEFSQEILRLSKKISENPKIQESLEGLPQDQATMLIPYAAVAAAAVYVIVVYSVGAGINWAGGIVAWLEVMVSSRSAQNTMLRSMIKDENILKLWVNKDITIQKNLIKEYARQIIEVNSSL